MIIYYNKLENQLKDKSIQKHVVSSQDNFLENKVVKFHRLLLNLLIV